MSELDERYAIPGIMTPFNPPNLTERVFANANGSVDIFLYESVDASIDVDRVIISRDVCREQYPVFATASTDNIVRIPTETENVVQIKLQIPVEQIRLTRGTYGVHIYDSKENELKTLSLTVRTNPIIPNMMEYIRSAYDGYCDSSLFTMEQWERFQTKDTKTSVKADTWTTLYISGPYSEINIPDGKVSFIELKLDIFTTDFKQHCTYNLKYTASLKDGELVLSDVMLRRDVNAGNTDIFKIDVQKMDNENKVIVKGMSEGKDSLWFVTILTMKGLS